MSERDHKRKRSLQDSPVDLSKMRMALNRLEALKEELDGIEETEEELHTIPDHVLALENILKDVKKPVRCIFLELCTTINDAPESDFLNSSSEDLKKAGVARKRLAFEPAKVTELTKGLTTNAEAEIVDLHSRIKKIYARVNMDVRLASITFRSFK